MGEAAQDPGQELIGDPPRRSERETAERALWRSMVSTVLTRAGAASDDPERTLTSTTIDGIEVRPLYAAGDGPTAPDGLGLPGRAPFVRGASGEPRAWDVRQRHATSDGSSAIRDDLAHGVTSIWLDVGDDDIASVGEIAAAVDGAPPGRTQLVLDAGASAVEAAAAVLASGGGANWHGNIGADPVGSAHRTGHPVDPSVAVAAMSLCVGRPGLRPIVVDGTVYHDAGGSDADELAITLAAGVAYLRALTDAGTSVENALAALEFRFAVTDDQFASIAKLRAARRVWNRVGELCGAPERARAQEQHAVTSSAMMTRRDPYVNVLRATIAGFAAAVGGARAITVAPFDQAVGRSDPTARRIARNTQAVLHDEVSLARVADPAGGSWYVEARTEALARQAWALFTGLERAGGATNLAAVAAMIDASRQRRDTMIAEGEFPITGVNRFVDEHEEPLRRQTSAAQTRSGGLPRIRYAQAEEAGWPS